MICADSTIKHTAIIADCTVVFPKVYIGDDTEDDSVQPTVIGEKNIIEELCVVRSSSIGDNNLLEVGCQIIKTILGNNNLISPKCVLKNCTIGNNCAIGPAIVLDGTHIPDNTSVFMVGGKWRCKPVDVKIMESVIQSYRERLTNLESQQCLSKNFTILDRNNNF